MDVRRLLHLALYIGAIGSSSIIRSLASGKITIKLISLNLPVNNDFNCIIQTNFERLLPVDAS